MKKNKRSLKKLALNKSVVSKLESQQANGGAQLSVQVCPVPVDTFWNCPIDTLVCPIDTWICPIDTKICPIDTLVCPIDTIACPIDTIACPY
ncbi:hypothetical protein KORDIASMS9_01512 [Kordia sp. SMS9]|uniref:class I lanthipeptide n=1 Tax=Kordia sp. SMS9 TaxID=2282170 RepID=UPI000E0CEA02|nr:class I lanthipeptide [Kordia sp. SMS9]AXG69292.1 hypothetical protein KORDIASMS9_01512 [Kordia sp. SMS9]